MMFITDIFSQLNGIWTLLFIGRTSMLIGWVDLIRRPFNKRNDFASVDARSYSNNPKNYEMITSPPTTYATLKTPNPLASSPPHPSEHEERSSQLLQSPPSPSSQYTTNDYFDNHRKEVTGSKSRHLSFSLPQDADYKSPKLSFSTPRPPSAGRSFSRESYGRYHQQQHIGRTSLSPQTTTRRESGGSTFSSAYDWDPTTTYAPPTTTTHVPSYSRPDAYKL